VNILQVLPVFPPSPLNLASGVVHVVYHISNELVKRGHEVTICTSSASGIDGAGQLRGFNNPVVLDGVKIYYFPYQISFDHFYVTPRLVPFMRDTIDHFDIAHLHDIRCFQSLVVYRYARKRERPYVLQLHGSYLGTFEGNKLKWLLDSVCSSKVLRDSNRLIALNKTEAAYCEERGIAAEKIDIVPNGIDVSKYGQALVWGRFRKKFGIRKDELVILYVGRIASTKGLDLLLEAFLDVKTHLPTAKLVLVGPDDLRFESTLKKRAKNLKIEGSTLFTGPVSESDKIDAYIDADVFVTPSFTGLPLTFLESCACGTPIVTTNNGDDIDWIHGHVGYVVNYDKNDVANAISSILLDERTRAEFKVNCKKLAQEQFAWPRIVDEIEKTYRRAADN
jgi:glycosyltransferase involved in cell wall biosynthesis